VSARFGGLRWRLLGEVDELEPVAGRFSDDEVGAWLGRRDEPVLDVLRRRRERDRAGQAVMLVGDEDELPATLAGLSEYESLETLATWSFVARDCWGRGLNRVNYALLWRIASELLGLPRIVASIDAENANSLAAHRALWPEAEVDETWEPWVPRRAVRILIDRLPRGADAAEPLDEIAALLERSPAVRTWRGRA
jgi:hypothetical protein